MAQDVLDCTIYFDLMEAVLRDGPPASFDAVTSPVLLAWGTKDKILPESRYAPVMRRSFRTPARSTWRASAMFRWAMIAS